MPGLAAYTPLKAVTGAGDVVSATPANGAGVALLLTLNLAGLTQFDIEGAFFDGTYDELIFTLNDSDCASLQAQIKSGGAYYTGSAYYYSIVSLGESGTPAWGSNGTNYPSSPTTAISFGTMATPGKMKIYVDSPAKTNRYPRLSWDSFGGSTSSGARTMGLGYCNGLGSVALQGLRFIGSFSRGTLTIHGVKKA